MVTITFEEIAEHFVKDDLKEWAKAKGLNDKQRQACEDMMQKLGEKLDDAILYGINGRTE